MESILQGMLPAVEEIASKYPQYGKEGVEFLKALRYNKDEEGNATEPFKWRFAGVKEYLEVFNKTKEMTACGPSVINVSQWKAACK